MQQAWPACGKLACTIIEDCEAIHSSDRESYWIKYYNAYLEGFNCTELGNSPGIGHTHCAAKLNEEDYLCIVYFLAYTSWTHKAISEELEVPVTIVESISGGYSHTNLKEVIPIEYTLMLAKQRKGMYQVIDRGHIISPNGEVFNVINITEFALTHGLERTSLGSVLKGTRTSHKGWKRYKC
jgi:hypothetical protein